MKRSEILNAAINCVTKDRAKDHGEPEDSFTSIAKYWSCYLNRDITVHDVGMMMALFKIGRIEQNREHADSYVDACGYLSICGEFGTKTPPPKDPFQCLRHLCDMRMMRIRELERQVSQLTEKPAGEAVAGGGPWGWKPASDAP